jgi:glutaminase
MQKTDVAPILKTVYEQVISNSQGELASYIPELALVNPNLFAISYVDVHGQQFSIGDCESLFTLQSTSKPITYSLALQLKGEEFVHSKVGVEPTGEAFNSIIELEEKLHRPFNPMINSGAIATTSLIEGTDFNSKLDLILEHFEKFVGHKLTIDEKVFASEKKTAHRNRAIAHLMKHFDVIDSDIEETLDLYFKQCSILVNCNDLAMIAGTLASGGVQPKTQVQVMSADHVVKTLSLMFTCGMYDTAGEWAFRVGLPAKSGVSGALFVVVPGQFGLAVYSPRIDSHGHSYRGREAVELITKKLNTNIFKSIIKD